ncbi:hypothetical protein [Nocardia sp. CA-120079]|uniref:hypothetical protein n=1 Tax=Nocardia sp. CA-120079 TaxID=3239974 RepID=UPI003D9991B1
MARTRRRLTALTALPLVAADSAATAYAASGQPGSAALGQGQHGLSTTSTPSVRLGVRGAGRLPLQVQARPRAVGAHRAARAATGNAARAAVAFKAALAVMLAGSGVALAAPPQQPGVTDPEQPGVTTAPREQSGVSSPAPTPPPKPQQQSPLGSILPDPPVYGPQEYRNPPSRSGGSGAQSSYYAQPPTTLGEDLGGLHAPMPVEPQKIITPPTPEWLGTGDAKIPRPDWVPPDVAWHANAYMALAQRDVNTWLNSIGFSESRSDRIATGTVVGVATGGTIGFFVIGAPAAVGGSLIGGTIGGIVGAAAGTIIPVPVIGTVTSGVAGTVIGAAAGALIGATVIGVPAALLGALVGGTFGAVATAGDGSDYVAPPEDSPARPTPAAPAPGPSLHDQVQQAFTGAGAAAEGAVDAVAAQPGGQQLLQGAADAVAAGVDWVQSQPWAPAAADAATNAARDAVSWAKAQPPLTDLVTVTIDVLDAVAPFAPGQLGPLTDAANAGLAAVQEAVTP